MFRDSKHHQEGFKKDKAEQAEFFKEKITVSKNIREIKEKEEKQRGKRLQ